MKTVRQSSFELLRITAQYMIIVYHILMVHFVTNGAFDNPIFQALWLPLHIGVPLFIILSGYFGIRFSLGGVAKLITYMLLFDYVPNTLWNYLSHDISVIRLFPVSGTIHWFMRCYLMLFCLSPIVNKYINNISKNNRLFLLIILAYISTFPILQRSDISLAEGKNVINFFFWYLIGNTLRQYQSHINKIDTRIIVFLYLFLNIIIVTIYCLLDGSFISRAIFALFFPYNSFGIVVNSVLCFSIFSRMSFQSSKINIIAESCLSIFLLHCSYWGIFCIIKKIVIMLQNSISSIFTLILTVLLLSLVVLIVCVIIDKICSPIKQYIQSHLTKVLNNVFGKISAGYI